MRVLFVFSGNHGEIRPFIKELGDSLLKFNIEVFYFPIVGRGIFGYLKNISLLKKQIKLLNIDLIHAHYGLSGLLSTFQRKVPVVITFHGSDINFLWNRFLSSIASLLATKSIFVSRKMIKIIKVKNSEVIPCGVDMEVFTEVEKNFAREKLNLDSNKSIILFSSSFDNKVKNYKLAKKAIGLIGNDHQLIELKNYCRKELNLLLNAADLLLLTSFSEGSPQIIKEAMACNCPIVATDVGDIKEVISNTESCYITSFNPKDVSNKIMKVLEVKKRTNGRENIMKLDNRFIAKKIISIYNKILGIKND